MTAVVMLIFLEISNHKFIYRMSGCWLFSGVFWKSCGYQLSLSFYSGGHHFFSLNVTILPPSTDLNEDVICPVPHRLSGHQDRDSHSLNCKSITKALSLNMDWGIYCSFLDPFVGVETRWGSLDVTSQGSETTLRIMSLQMKKHLQGFPNQTSGLNMISIFCIFKPWEALHALCDPGRLAG